MLTSEVWLTIRLVCILKTDSSFTASSAIWVEVEMIYLEVCETIVCTFTTLLFNMEICLMRGLTELLGMM